MVTNFTNFPENQLTKDKKTPARRPNLSGPYIKLFLAILSDWMGGHGRIGGGGMAGLAPLTAPQIRHCSIYSTYTRLMTLMTTPRTENSDQFILRKIRNLNDLQFAKKNSAVTILCPAAYTRR